MTRTVRNGRLGVACWTLVSCLLFGASARAGAQQITGTVRDSVTNLRIPGAVVQLLDASGTATAGAITDERGAYRLLRAPAATRLRVVRIGFRPRDIALAQLPAGTTTIDLAMLRIPSLLESVRVTDNARCPRRADRSAALGLWEQVRAGLLSSVVSREAKRGRMEVLAYDRIYDGPEQAPERLTVQRAIADRTGAFGAAMSADEFVRTGFSRDSAGITTYFGPDADVLLGDGFTNGYCFHVMDRDPKRPMQVGLGFAPADTKRGRIDIDGALWIDTTARELKEIAYRYVGLPKITDVFKPGGEIHFRQMPNGLVVIDRWFLRLVGARKDTIDSGSIPRTRTRMFVSEAGGELAHATWPDSTRYDGSLGSFSLRATTTTGKPVVNTVLALPGTMYRETTDSLGLATFRDLVPGPYPLRALDERLGQIGVSIDTKLRLTAVRDSTIRVDVKVPTAEEYVIDRCIEAHQWTRKDSVFVVGRAMTPASEAIVDLKITFEVNHGTDWVMLPDFYTTGTDGIFQSCSVALRPGSLLRIRAHWQGEKVGEEIRMLDRSVIVVPMYLGEKKP